jgi:hypothetical protein
MSRLCGGGGSARQIRIGAFEKPRTYRKGQRYTTLTVDGGGRPRTDGGGSACLPRQGERQVQFHAIVRHFGLDASAVAPFKADKPVAFQGPQGA